MFSREKLNPDFIIDGENLDDFAYSNGAKIELVGRYWAQACKHLSYLEDQVIPHAKGTVTAQFKGVTNPNTNKPYTEAEMDFIRHNAPWYQELMIEVSDWKEKEKQLEAKFKALVAMSKSIDAMSYRLHAHAILRNSQSI